MLLYIDWNVSPILLELGPLQIRWYGLMFAVGFLIGYQIVAKMFTRDGVSHDYLDSLLLYIFVGTVVGARFGQVVFWEWDYYSQNLLEIPQIWKGGLASHGAMVILPLLLWYYASKVIKKPALWLLDRVAVPVAMVGAFIRIGNVFNHEIVGKESSAAWAFLFDDRFCGDCGGVPRHPVQLYESISYLIIFAILMFLYWRTDASKKQGFLFGAFLVGVFGMRIVWEFFKQHFIPLEETLLSTINLNLGQLMSIPAVLLGLFLIFRRA